jgi:tetratricopeptide (TPR) repeat protein
MSRHARKPHSPVAAAPTARESLLRAACEQGRLHERCGQLAEAQALYGAVLEADPLHSDALWRSAAVATALGRRETASRLLALAVTSAPARADIHNDLALALLAEDRIAEALTACLRTIELEPARIDARINRAAIERCRGRYDLAARCAREALRLDPDSRPARLNLAGALAETGDLAEAIALLDELVERDRADAQARWTRALVCLYAGRLDAGWRDFDARWRSPTFSGHARPHGHPPWTADPDSNGHVLVWREQGVGDEILYASMIPDLVERTQKVTIECDPRLTGLLARSFPDARVLPALDPPDPRIDELPVDAQISFASLAPLLRPTLASFPGRRSYLVPEAQRVQAWRGRLAALAGLKVGLCWRSSDLRGERRLACLRIEQLAPLLRIPGITFVNLQYDECRAELDQAATLAACPVVAFDDLDLRNDFDGTAALIASLDLVISAPTTVSVLAGAVGTPVWQLTCGIDWHCLGAAHSPWQPALVRFHRAWDRTWESILAPMIAPLGRLAADATRNAAAAELTPFGTAAPDIASHGT